MNDIKSAISGSRITVGELYDILVDLQANGLIGAKQVQRRSKYYEQFDSPESYNTYPLPDRTELTEPNIILLKLLKAYMAREIYSSYFLLALGYIIFHWKKR
jgi:Transcriptional regulator PadR-like family